MDYLVLAYYFFTQIEDPARDVLWHKEFFSARDAQGRIYLSQEGINGQISASPAAADAYMQWLKSDSRFQGVEFKIHTWHEHCFPRMTIKMRPQLVALDAKVDLSQTGTRLSPEEWRAMLESRDAETLLLDVRNSYEWDIGHFEGANLPQLETFRQFPAYVRQLKEERDLKKTKIMMYCTGGIRCELYSALMKQEGFEHVYQLDGGIIKYGLEEGSKLWRGKLFVFDDRLSVPVSPQETSEVISVCKQCQTPTDLYFNCANMDCNELFLSCPSCADTTAGCCTASCKKAPRVRPFVKQDRPKPFRRWNTGLC